MGTSPITLVVSADRLLRQVIVDGLGELECATYDATGHADALAHAARLPVDVAIIDVNSRTLVGSQTIRELRSHQPHLRVVYLMGSEDVGLGRGLSATAHDTCLRKPFRLDELCDIVSAWLVRRRVLHAVTSMSVN
jgi:DNA-binding response OmpR family regulator